MAELIINDRVYSIRKLDARKQFHIMRRLSPIFSELAGAMKSGHDDLAALGSLATALSTMSDSDADYCLYGLLQAVSVKDGNSWASLVVGDNTLAYQNVDLPVMMQLAGAAIKENFAGFFGSGGQNSAAQAAK